MSGYDYKKYKNPGIQNGWYEPIAEAGLDKIEICILEAIGMKLKDLKTLVESKRGKKKNSVRRAELGLEFRRRYDELFPTDDKPTLNVEKKIAARAKYPSHVSLRGKSYEEQWVIVQKKAELNDRETEIAKLMYMTPDQVLSMVPPANTASKEDWKDSPALHIRRLYDEQHVHPALVTYWDIRQHQSPFSKTYLQKQERKAEKREKKREWEELKKRQENV